MRLAVGLKILVWNPHKISIFKLLGNVKSSSSLIQKPWLAWYMTVWFLFSSSFFFLAELFVLGLETIISESVRRKGMGKVVKYKVIGAVYQVVD